LDTLLFADDQVIVAQNEDELQRAVYNLQVTASEFNMSISAEETKIIAFALKEPVTSKICVNGKILEQVNTFNYLGCALSYEGEKDMEVKISKFVKATGVIESVLKPSFVQKHTRLQVYKTLARPVLSYGSEAWTIKKTGEKLLKASEMKFMRITAGYTLFDHERSEDILKELQIEPVITHVQNHRANWRNHVRRIERVIIPKQLTYAPRGRRCLGRPNKHETITGHLA
jgi:hypothetical protein